MDEEAGILVGANYTSKIDLFPYIYKNLYILVLCLYILVLNMFSIWTSLIVDIETTADLRGDVM